MDTVSDVTVLQHLMSAAKSVYVQCKVYSISKLNLLSTYEQADKHQPTYKLYIKTKTCLRLVLNLLRL